MPSVKTNIIANYAGSIWTALMQLAFVPLYIKFMGIESYGLIGFFGTLVAMFAILDMGLSATLNRELAIRSALPGQEQSSRDLLRTVEIIYWTVAVVIGAAVIALSYPVARYWVNAESLSMSDVQQAVMIMGLVTILRWPFGMYQGGLLGLQRQVLVNGLNCFTGTLRGVGAVLVLWLVSPTVQAFFGWQIVVSGLETFASAYFLWRSMPVIERRPRFQKALILEIWRFAGGMMGISVIGMLFIQADKIVLSRMLSLENYGYYMLAWSLSVGLLRIVNPIVTAIYPQLTILVAKSDNELLATTYHKSVQFLSVALIPPAMIIAFFSAEIIGLWFGNPYIAQRTHWIASLLIIGLLSNAFVNIPYVTQLSYGWTSLHLVASIVSLVLCVPFMILLTSFYGMIGGVSAWVGFNLGYFVIVIPLMHLRILKGELWRFYFVDIGIPLMATLLFVLLGRSIVPPNLSKLQMIMTLCAFTAAAYFVAVMATPEGRSALETMLTKLRLMLRSTRTETL